MYNTINSPHPNQSRTKESRECFDITQTPKNAHHALDHTHIIPSPSNLLLLLIPWLLLPPLLPQPLLPKIQPPSPQPLQLSLDLVPLERDPVCVLGLGPELGDGESRVEVGAKVVHDSDGEHDVHSELEDLQVKTTHLACIPPCLTGVRCWIRECVCVVTVMKLSKTARTVR